MSLALLNRNGSRTVGSSGVYPAEHYGKRRLLEEALAPVMAPKLWRCNETAFFPRNS